MMKRQDEAEWVGGGTKHEQSRFCRCCAVEWSHGASPDPAVPSRKGNSNGLIIRCGVPDVFGKAVDFRYRGNSI